MTDCNSVMSAGCSIHLLTEGFDGSDTETQIHTRPRSQATGRSQKLTPPPPDPY